MVGAAARMKSVGAAGDPPPAPVRPPAGGAVASNSSIGRAQRSIREIFVPSMLTPAISPCWSKMKA